MEITNKQIANYTESFTTSESEIVRELVKVSEQKLQYTDMLSGRQVGMLLKLLVQVSGAKRILEIGTFTGYSALMMAEALPEGGELVTCEVNEKYRIISEPFFSAEPFNRKIRQVTGNALETIPDLDGTFDLIFLDADKVNYPEYYRLAKNRIRKGGFIVADNTLWGGEVLNPQDEKSKAIHHFNEIIRDDEEVQQVMIPLRDGITVVRVQS
ncbi:MAG: class I SAM-dependent methyltransferase [Balneolaceae bacterium]